LHLALTLAAAAGVVALVWGAIDRPATHPLALALALVLTAVNAVWLAAAAATALIGRRPVPVPVAAGARPGPCAVLWLICGEPPGPLAARAAEMRRGLAATGQGDVAVWVLSDTADPARVAEERALFGALPGVTYRHRARPQGRKPGNLHDWLSAHGTAVEAMLVLDADSGFSARRLWALRQRLAADPRLALIQTGVALRPGTSRLAALQRLSTRLCGPVLARGTARLSGTAAPWWGHNALIRTRAFAQVTPLTALSGRAPWGGPILSHDFIEAAHLARAGWRVAFDPDSRGSFEEAPEAWAALTRRDRRWAQGNLQHLRLIGAPGLRGESRFTLAAGIQSYLSAPVWLGIVVLFGSGAVHAQDWALAPVAAMLGLLMIPKLAGAWPQGRGRAGRRWRVRLRAMAAELALSTLIAPLMMLRQSAAVLAVAAGRDCGWRPAGAPVAAGPARPGAFEAAGGGALLAAVVVPQALLATSPAAPVLAGIAVLPLVGPLLAAPWLVRWLDAPARARGGRVGAYYDASTRRFLAVGGSGGALAIHRPLWDDGVGTPEQAAGRINALVAEAAEAALGRAPARVADLGCGVGGTLFHLAGHWPEAALTGVTISAVQVRLARQLAASRGLDTRCHFVEGDFTRALPRAGADLALAIESHVHAPDAASFLRAAQAHLRPGGVLLVVDDMLARPPASPAEARLLDAFRRGWRLGHVPTVEGLEAEARALGFEPAGSRDLSGMLRLDRWRDRALRGLGPLADALGLGRWPVFANMIGGNALTQAHRRGLMCYRLVVFRLPPAAVEPVAERSAA
jgi:SAM-dependent methyltransferase